MTLQELLLDEELDRVRRRDLAWTAFEDEARRRQSPGGIRRALGGAFVRLGVWLDRTAGEPAVNASYIDASMSTR